MDFQALSVFRLDSGAHDRPEDGLCFMEAAAWLEGLPHSDSPPCTCDVIAAYCRGMNDWLPDEDRQRLVAYLPRVVGTVSPEHRQERAEFLAWAAIRTFAPVALTAAGLEPHASALKAAGSLEEAEVAAKVAAKVAAEAAATYTVADVATSAANAANAANAAKVAAEVAAEAAANAAVYVYAAADVKANRRDIIEASFAALDGLLAIGPSSGFTADIAPRVADYRTMVNA